MKTDAHTLGGWLLKLKEEVERTNNRYPLNLVPGWPIPFFGDVLHSRVLTVGVNPSDQEFNPGRHWDAITNPEQWQARLLNYFAPSGVPPWYWFDTWSICLELLNLSYAGGEAAHIDVSPRPTTPMLDQRTHPTEFRAMVEHDVKWFFQLLDQLPQVQLLLVAGPVPTATGGRQQLADFIREQAGNHGAEWMQGAPLPSLITPTHPEGIPVFVCPYEPRVDGLYAMVRQVYRNREILRRLSAPRIGSVPVLPARSDWPSAIGLFIINFGMLDLHFQDYLETNLPPEEFLKFKERPFYDRAERIKEHLSEAGYPLEKKQAMAQFFAQLEPIRVIRNHIAHGLLRIGLAEDQKTRVLTLSRPRDLDGSNSPDTRHLTYRELLTAGTALTDLVEDFENLFGKWVVDADIKF